jgi:hypothetical protein
MAWQLGIHGTNDGHLVNALGEFRKQIAYGDSTLTMLRKGKWGWQGHSGFSLGLEILEGQDLAGSFGQLGFGVERIDLRNPTIQKHMDNMLGLARKMQRQSALGRQALRSVLRKPSG